MHDLTIRAFALADRYRTPVLVLADGRLGQMMEPVTLHEGPPPPVPAKPWALTGARGRAPNRIRSLFLEEGLLEELNTVLQDVYREITANAVAYETRDLDDAELAVIAYGSSARIARGALIEARAAGLKAGILRPISLWPFPYAPIRALAERVRGILVVEMSAGQMLEDVRLAVEGRAPVRFLGRMGGGVPTEAAVVDALKSLEAA
jgi:2-oxoglutarate/2-oxoacid ferredoxin oxidoreductase subunit alpha